MSEHIHKAHNVSARLYHLVCPTKYRRAVISEEIIRDYVAGQGRQQDCSQLHSQQLELF